MDKSDMDKEDAKSAQEEEAARLRFQAIVEAEGEGAEDEDGAGGPPRAYRPFAPDEVQTQRPEPARDWGAMARQTLLVTRMIAVFWLFAVFVGWPLGDALAHRAATGALAGWSIWNAITFEGFLLAIVASLLTLLIGYIASRLLHTVSAAETIAHAANQLITPDASAAENARLVGSEIRGQMDALNSGLDHALARLASVEAMIRQHVEAIEVAGASIETRATGAVGRIADERARLIDLTEQLNAQADAFAAAIAAKAQASIEALHSADDIGERAQAQLEERLNRLDAAAQSALQSFNALGEALQNADEAVRASAGRIEASGDETRRASEKASKAATEAAEAAARNAAEISAAAMRAAEEARKAADHSVERSAQEAARAAQAAVEAAERESRRVAEAAGKAVEAARRSAEDALSTASKDAQKASASAEEIAEAARRAAKSAEEGAADIERSQSREAERIEARSKALADARAALEAENNRLESLITEQRARADRLADAIAQQTDRLTRLAATASAEAQKREEEQRRAEAEAEAEAEAAETPRAADPQPKAPAKPRKPQEKPLPPPDEVLDLGDAAKPAAPRKPAPAGTRQRLDELADDIAQRRNGAAKPERRDKQSVSWREILDATDEAQPLDLAAASSTPPEAPAPAEKNGAVRPAAADAIRIISELQNFTLDLETRLYGDPPPALRERFGRGDRNVFANRILRLNETDVKRRIRAEAGRDKAFERDVHGFLQGFERLLEDATTSETADEELEEYLSSPLGRVYLLIGATVGYFA